MPSLHSRCGWTALAVACLLLTNVALWGQEKPAEKPAEKKAPPPQDVPLTTKDNLELTATFFPGTKGKDTVPVILVHAYKGSRNDYKDLAKYLQSLGHAVIVPDLRGHGASTRFKETIGPKSKSLEAATLAPDQFTRMVEYDMETVNGFLLAKNNAGELNIEKLCVVGAELGAVVALDWARLDWSWPTLGAVKQGQDVKALVLISPEWAVKSLKIDAAMRHPEVSGRLSILILAGKQKRQAEDQAKRLNAAFERFHRKPEKPEDRDLFLGLMDTSLQGTKMLGVKGLNVERLIAEFIELRLVKQNFPWRMRGVGGS